MELIRLAKRPDSQPSTRGQLEEEIQKKLFEESLALRKSHFLRARDMRDCIEELQILRTHLPTLDELQTEEASLQYGLDKAVSARRYDVADGIQTRFAFLEKQIQKEKEWKDPWQNKFAKLTERASAMKSAGHIGSTHS
jgi:hypothetical protein